MRWFRRNRRSGGAVALAALTLQLALAFAHVHAVGPARSELGLAGKLLASKSAEAIVQAPSKGNGPHQSELNCDICATINLAGTAPPPPPPPEIVPPRVVSTAPFSAPDDNAFGVRRYVLAQSRAPPSL